MIIDNLKYSYKMCNCPDSRINLNFGDLCSYSRSYNEILLVRDHMIGRCTDHQGGHLDYINHHNMPRRYRESENDADDHTSIRYIEYNENGKSRYFKTGFSRKTQDYFTIEIVKIDTSFSSSNWT